MSPLFTAADLAQATGGGFSAPFAATGVSIDTRTLQQGDLFVALVTETGDGHDHVPEALARGAAGALVHRAVDGPHLRVADTLAALHALGGFGRARFSGRVAAITGSVGKTTTKEMLRLVLGASGRTHAAHASYNNHWGVPLTLARLPGDADYAVIEIGTNHPGEIAPLARLAAPHAAAITAIEATHIGNFGDLAAIAMEKASIAEGLVRAGILVLPEDHALRFLLAAVSGSAVIRYFGGKNLMSLRQDADGSDIEAAIGAARLNFRLGAPGRHMVSNALVALTIADALGADVAAGAATLAEFRPVGGRGARRLLLGGTATLLDESYNASSASIRAALGVLKLLPARRRVAVLGDMLELGEHSGPEHRNLADAVTDSADLLYACGPWMRTLFDAVPPAHRGGHAETSALLAPIVADAAAPGDAILVKGSFGSRMRAVVDALEARHAV